MSSSSSSSLPKIPVHVFVFSSDYRVVKGLAYKTGNPTGNCETMLMSKGGFNDVKKSTTKASVPAVAKSSPGEKKQDKTASAVVSSEISTVRECLSCGREKTEHVCNSH